MPSNRDQYEPEPRRRTTSRELVIGLAVVGGALCLFLVAVCIVGVMAWRKADDKKEQAEVRTEQLSRAEIERANRVEIERRGERKDEGVIPDGRTGKSPKAADGRNGKSPKAATNSEELLASLPRDSWPKGGEDGAPERKVTELWMKKNLVGTQIEWTAKITEVRVEDDGGEKLRLALALDSTAFEGYGGRYGFCPWPATKAFGDELRVHVHPDEPVTSLKGYGFLYKSLSPDEAKAIRDMNGKQVRVRTSVREVGCQFDNLRKLDSGYHAEPPGNSTHAVVVILTVNPPILNDYLPPSIRPGRYK